MAMMTGKRLIISLRTGVVVFTRETVLIYSVGQQMSRFCGEIVIGLASMTTPVSVRTFELCSSCCEQSPAQEL